MEFNPIISICYDHNGAKFHSVAIKKKEYFSVLERLQASNPTEIPALYISYSAQIEWLFDAAKAEKDVTLTVSPHFANADADKLRRYLGLNDDTKTRIDINLPDDWYDRIIKKAPREVISSCIKLGATLKFSQRRKEILNLWINDLPTLIGCRKRGWWDRYFEDALLAFEVAQMHHLALGQIKHFDKYLTKMTIGSCYFLATQNTDPYIEEIEETHVNDDERDNQVRDQTGPDVPCHSDQ